MREFINKYRRGIAAVMCLAILVGVASLFFRSPRRLSAGEAPKVYFSDDDGKSFFADARDKPSGFDHGGRPAYLANVFFQGSGKPFVGFLRRTAPAPAHPTAVASQMIAAGKFGAGADKPFKKVVPVAPSLMAAPGSTQTEIKEPGDSNWHALNDSVGIEIMRKYGPVGQESSGLEPAMP